MNSKNIVTLKERSAPALRPFESLGRVFEDLFDLAPAGRAGEPRIDVRETDAEIVVTAALPGVDKKDIGLDLTEDTLAIACERREEKAGKDRDGYTLKEQSYGRFFRSFTLPAPVKTDGAKAVYKDGALKIVLPKREPGKARRINIE
jgi:HSP20 family protein